MSKRVKPVTAAVGAAFVTSLASVSFADVQDDPFAVAELDAGYDLVANAEEGKCGEGKCGEGKDGEGKCGEDKDGDDKDGEGKCGEGKCGEGKCGGIA
jgi:uncharacterized low-complexity protein